MDFAVDPKKMDLVIENGLLVETPDLFNSVLMSLSSDQFVSLAEAVKKGLNESRGWWADILEPEQNIGSNLWTLSRSKTNDLTVQLVKTYAEKSLKWMVDDKWVDSVFVSAEKRDRERIDLNIILVKSGKPVTFELNYNPVIQQVSYPDANPVFIME